MTTRWLVDTSVLLAAAFGQSQTAANWLTTMKLSDNQLVGSLWLETEALRAVVNRELNKLPLDGVDVAGYLSGIVLGDIDNELAIVAASIRQPLRAGDALHIATALRLGVDEVGIATHDAQMATTAKDLGFTVIDPVTDDPRRPPVA